MRSQSENPATTHGGLSGIRRSQLAATNSKQVRGERRRRERRARVAALNRDGHETGPTERAGSEPAGRESATGRAGSTPEGGRESRGEG